MSDTNAVAGAETPRFGYELYRRESALEVEVWPLSGEWTPFVAVVANAERALLNSVSFAPRSERTVGMRAVRRVDVEAGGLSGIGLHNEITPQVSARIFLSATPREVQFGPVGARLHVLRFDPE